VLAWAALPPPPAQAHAELQKANPDPDASLKAAPTEIRLWFSEALEPAFSTIEVDDASGQSVTHDKAALDPNDAKELVLVLPALPPGKFTVEWHAVSVDTHKTRGTYTFRIAP
jgi:copper resistance protein C